MFLTQSELAKELGVSIASVARWETGENEPTMKITIMHLIHITLPIQKKECLNYMYMMKLQIKKGIYLYVLDGLEKHLNIRVFIPAQKLKA